MLKGADPPLGYDLVSAGRMYLYDTLARQSSQVLATLHANPDVALIEQCVNNCLSSQVREERKRERKDDAEVNLQRWRAVRDNRAAA